jgi:hypothetical protein
MQRRSYGLILKTEPHKKDLGFGDEMKAEEKDRKYDAYSRHLRLNRRSDDRGHTSTSLHAGVTSSQVHRTGGSHIARVFHTTLYVYSTTVRYITLQYTATQLQRYE